MAEDKTKLTLLARVCQLITPPGSLTLVDIPVARVKCHRPCVCTRLDIASHLVAIKPSVGVDHMLEGRMLRLLTL